ncbi:hypothetical protein HZB58_05860 [Candidatus Gottesmanbacteria bacterium]|nr:hypothetical protein [Candidatus Gottesmanbacteria bacterium]
MDISSPAITYVLLVIPTFFALAVMFQGISKMAKAEKDGSVAFGFGAFLLVLIAAAYFLFIR